MRLTPTNTDLAQAARSSRGGQRQRVGVAPGALESPGLFASLAAFFPDADFGETPSDWPKNSREWFDVVIVGLPASEAEPAVRWMAALPKGVRPILLLHDADVMTSRRLLHGGAADVLPAPASEAALALSLERLLNTAPARDADDNSGQVVALLKAGGGVGATSLGMQVAALLARRSQSVCFADLDVQFGAGSVYFDLPDALTVADCLSAGASIADTPFASALATHPSGARLLAAPRDVTTLDAVSPANVDGLVSGLRRDIGLTVVDLPSVWTAWTAQVLQLADRIILVTHLTVPHIQLIKRQLRVLADHRLDFKPITLVCNAVTPEQLSSLPMKAVERALGRSFDIVIPEDRRTMTAAINQGTELSAIRRGTKLEKAVAALAGGLSATASAPVAAPRRR